MTIALRDSTPEFHQKIILTDEARQNCRKLGPEKTRFLVEKPLYPQLFGVVYGPAGTFLLENEAGAPVTVNGLCYREVINDFLWPE